MKSTVRKSDAKELNQAAVDAVKQWVFKPAVMAGKPVVVWVSIPFRFKLASEQEKPSRKQVHGSMADLTGFTGVSKKPVRSTWKRST